MLLKSLSKIMGMFFQMRLEKKVRYISENGGTPLVVSKNEKATGVIELQDIIKPGILERFQRLRKMGVKTVMVTGDNPLDSKIHSSESRSG